MIRRPPRSTLSSSSAASDVYKRQVCDLRIVGGLRPRSAGRAERGQRRCPQGQLGASPAKELLVLRVGTWPAALDEADPEVVEVAGDRQLVVDRQRQSLPLGAVAQRGVVDVKCVTGLRHNAILRPNKKTFRGCGRSAHTRGRAR